MLHGPSPKPPVPIKCWDVTFSSPEENLACDEVLLDLAEEGTGPECLRFWEPASYFVVVGYSNRVDTEVNLSACEALNIPVLRRCSGGGTVLQGHGCLNYSLILSIDGAPELRGISTANSYILQRIARSLSQAADQPVLTQGHTDLTIGSRKFSGNAQRRRKAFLLFHGCLLCDMNLQVIEKVLPMPSKQPDYRANRSHSDFITNLAIPANTLKSAIAAEWQAEAGPGELPEQRISALAREKYGSRAWNFKF